MRHFEPAGFVVYGSFVYMHGATRIVSRRTGLELAVDGWQDEGGKPVRILRVDAFLNGAFEPNLVDLPPPAPR